MTWWLASSRCAKFDFISSFILSDIYVNNNLLRVCGGGAGVRESDRKDKDYYIGRHVA